MHTFVDVTGRYHHTFRQSDLSEFHLCPEKLRTKPDGEDGTDATLIGTATHSGIEHFFNTQGEATEEECTTVMLDVLKLEWDNIRVVQCRSLEEAIERGKTSFAAFWNARQNFPMGGIVEGRFNVTGVYRDAKRVISFTGTPDYYSPRHNMIFDWKTGAHSYHNEFWKVERYAIQPTMYCLALYLAKEIREIPKFTFVRLPKDGKAIEMATVERDIDDFDALVHMAINLATLIESDPPTWPMMPTGWQCSPKWCATFRSGACMGLHWGDKPWAAPWMDITDTQYNALRAEGEQ